MNKSCVVFFLIISVLVLILIGGCAPSKKVLEKTGENMVLKYQLPADRGLRYNTKSNFLQKMDIRGQPMEIKSDQDYTYTITSEGITDDGNRLGFEINDMTMNFVGPQGEIIPDMSAVTGKGFDMLLTVEGEEKEYDGALTLEYEVIPGRVQNVASMFQNVFPDLSDRPLKIGDTWVSYDTSFEESSSGVVLTVFESVNRLEGFENINGYECARITAKINGLIDGVTHESGIEFITEGSLEGINTWFFATAEGILVKMSTSGSGDVTIASNGENKIVIPTKRSFSVETELLR